jgi:O-antigen/teichoic acid export membrane protein
MSALTGRVVRNTASNVVGQVVTLAIWFALTPFIIDRLGAADYGLWVLVGSLVAYGNLLDLGVGAAITKYVAELRARNESGRASELVATSLWIYAAIGAVVLLITVPLALAFPHLFKLAPDQASDARWVVVLTGLALAVKLPAIAPYAVLRGLQRYDLINAIGVLAALTQAAATVAVLLLGWGIVGMAALTLPLTLVWQIPMVLAIRRTAPDVRVGLRGARRDMIPMVGRFSGSLMVINSSSVLKTKTDELVIGAALPVAQVAPYSVARRVSDLPTIVTYQFVRVLMPLASQLEGEGDAARLRVMYAASTRVALALFVPVGAGLFVLGQPFIAAWVGADFAKDADVVRILIAAGLVDIAMWPAASMLQASNRHHFMAAAAAGSGVLNLGLSIALVGSLGVEGVALGTLIAAVVELVVVLPYAMRQYGVRLPAFARDVLAPVLLPAIPAVAVLVALNALLDPRSLVAVLAIGAAGAAVYGPGYLAFGASAHERGLLRRLVGGGGRPARSRA